MRALDRFTVHLTHPCAPPGWIWVVIHPDIDRLRRAATEYSPEVDHAETEATFQPRPVEVHLDDDRRVDRPDVKYAGVMRLLPTHGVATVAHEATHAACAIYLRQYAGVLDFTDDPDLASEEILAYAVGDIVGGIATEMLRRGHW